jgi:endonuclease/exonuclease/phosphatase family metal-dependent hydrolase
MHPLRISLTTYNIWADFRWDFRQHALTKFVEIFEPDVLCLQELRQISRDALDATLTGHRRVDDAFSGWTKQSNIYWRDTLFAEIEHGAEDVGITYEGDRRLFWVRLDVKGLVRSVLVATAHLTHQRHPDECATGQSPRVAETRRIIEALQRLNRDGEPLFFMGDLNDPVHPPKLLHEAGYVSCFAALGVQPSPTFKCYPTAEVAPGEPATNQCIDWLVANGAARAISASVPHFYFHDAAPSDHWPVQAVYEIGSK